MSNVSALPSDPGTVQCTVTVKAKTSPIGTVSWGAAGSGAVSASSVFPHA